MAPSEGESEGLSVSKCQSCVQLAIVLGTPPQAAGIGFCCTQSDQHSGHNLPKSNLIVLLPYSTQQWFISCLLHWNVLNLLLKAYNKQMKLTLCVCTGFSPGSISGWSQPTSGPAKPHTELLPRHRRGYLSRRVVCPLVQSFWIHQRRFQTYFIQAAFGANLKTTHLDRGNHSRPTVLFKTFCVCLCFVSLLTALCLLGTHCPPANGRRPERKAAAALSGTRRLWEMAVLLLSISTETQGPGGIETLEFCLNGV